MVKLQCKDCGFECDFLVEGNDTTQVILDFGKHTDDEHGIEYSKESLMQFIMRKGYPVWVFDLIKNIYLYNYII